MTEPAPPADTVEIGVITRAHGIRGELRVRLHNPDSAALENSESLLIDGEPHVLDSFRHTNDAILVRLDGVNDRTAAERFKGQTVSVSRECLGLDDGDVLLADLVGLRAVLASGADWGEVVRVETGAQHRLIISSEGRERQLPLVDAFVISVDLEAGTVVVDPPDDLPES